MTSKSGRISFTVARPLVVIFPVLIIHSLFTVGVTLGAKSFKILEFVEPVSKQNSSSLFVCTFEYDTEEIRA